MTSEILQGAHDFVFNNPQLNAINLTINSPVHKTKGKGLKLLLKESMPDAFYDSSARDPPPRCHPSTRKSFIDEITSWGLGAVHHTQRMLWMRGPAGAGKSAVAQSCTERLAKQNKLGAALFFSHHNERHDSLKLFTSLSYQIGTIFRAYGEILDRDILNDPNLLKKSRNQQFHDFFVKPLQEIRERGEAVEERVIIIDGLDECEGIDAQCDIIEIIAASVQNGTTPFRWAFFSRPEPHITASFESDHILPFTFKIELPVSREIDHEIFCYLADEFKKIRERNKLPASWPSEGDIETLVILSAGLFIYAATVIRFVGERDSLGPDDQLCAVLALATSAKGKTSSSRPLASLDLFYTLIMQRVPSKHLPVILKMLLFRSCDHRDLTPEEHANALGFSEAQVLTAFSSLQSVLELRLGFFSFIFFYHASFLDFIQDPERSKEFCVWSSCLDITRRELLDRLNNVHSQSMDCSGGSIRVDITWPHQHMNNEKEAYRNLLSHFFLLLLSRRPLESSTASALVDFQFGMIPHLLNRWVWPRHHFSPMTLRGNIPTEFRDKIVRFGDSLWLKLWRQSPAGSSRLYVLGYGKNKVICWESSSIGWALAPYPYIWKILFKR